MGSYKKSNYNNKALTNDETNDAIMLLQMTT